MKKSLLSLAVHGLLAGNKSLVSGLYFDATGTPSFVAGTATNVSVSPMPTGRPPATAKHMAVRLAWHIAMARYGQKRGLADEVVTKQFNYSEPKKVRDIRKRPLHDGSLFAVLDNSGGQKDVAILAEAVHAATSSPTNFHLHCTGWLWRPESGNKAVYGEIKVDGTASWKQGGPEVFASLKTIR
jgi:hypothetical protein